MADNNIIHKGLKVLTLKCNFDNVVIHQRVKGTAITNFRTVQDYLELSPKVPIHEMRTKNHFTTDNTTCSTDHIETTIKICGFRGRWSKDMTSKPFRKHQLT